MLIEKCQALMIDYKIYILEKECIWNFVSHNKYKGTNRICSSNTKFLKTWAKFDQSCKHLHFSKVYFYRRDLFSALKFWMRMVLNSIEETRKCFIWGRFVFLVFLNQLLHSKLVLPIPTLDIYMYSPYRFSVNLFPWS